MSERSTTEEHAAPDPFQLWRQFHEASEQALLRVMHEVMSKHRLPETEAKAIEMLMAFQRMMRDALSAQLDSLNLPTRDDVTRLAELVVSLEEKVDLLAARMSGLEQALVDQGLRNLRRPTPSWRRAPPDRPASATTAPFGATTRKQAPPSRRALPR